MGATLEKWRQVKKTFTEAGLQKTLLEVLLWQAPVQAKQNILVNDQAVTVNVLAELPGAAFIEIPSPDRDAASWHKAVDKELAKRFPERIDRFTNPHGDSWYWPKKLASGSISYDRLPTKSGELPDYLAQRLAGLSFTQREHTSREISPLMVKERIRGQFESSKITSDFFRKFKAKHEFLSSEIKGITDKEAASSYSTLLLNRLMFIYFLQKKEFLNDDPNYLRNCLSKIQQQKGKDRFYSFYRDYLLELFFNKLDNPEGRIADEVINEIAGDIPYVNGGVFSESAVEKENHIEIADGVFEEIFAFFDSYTWHLDTRPTGTADEINPEVIGYIFEQYINYTADGKKENGAYYTKQDVTGYMVGQTLVPRILDELIELGISPFQILKDSPLSYIHESLKHGGDVMDNTIAWKPVAEELFDCWTNDPVHWSLLDQTETDPEICLPDETWVEMFDRRERVLSLSEKIAEGEISEINELITLNLSSQKLLLDVVGHVEDSSSLEMLWDRVSRLSVIDPTCGSGAFLFSALEVLEVFYAAVLDKLEEQDPSSRIVLAKNSHPNRRYFLRKHAALRNIYGTDIMADAIETAKLRIFLALASCLETKSQLEPLPDLDFNLKTGNLVIGFVDSEDVSRVQNERLIVENRIDEIESSLADHLGLYDDFLDASANNSADLQVIKSRLIQSEKTLRLAANDYYAECVGKSSDEFSSWSKEALPFHWSIEFPAVFKDGGFDVVIGNPPYIKKTEVPSITRQSLIGFRTQDLPDFYAVCLERSDQIRNAKSRKAMIVMLSFAFAERFETVRSITLGMISSASWISTFGKRPDSLFQGVQVRNTILIQGPGDGNRATSHQIFTPAVRGWLFECLRYNSLSFSANLTPIRAGIAGELAKRFAETPRGLPLSTKKLFVRPTGQNWFPVIPSRPPVLNSKTLQVSEPDDLSPNEFFLWEGEDQLQVIALLASKLGYLWWSSTGDDFHSFTSQTVQVRNFLLRCPDKADLHELAEKVLEAAGNCVFGSKNAGAIYINIRWTDASRELDEFARTLLDASGLIDQWRPLNIWYRMTMRSSGENSNSVEIPESIRDKFLELPSG